MGLVRAALIALAMRSPWLFQAGTSVQLEAGNGAWISDGSEVVCGILR